MFRKIALSLAITSLVMGAQAQKLQKGQKVETVVNMKMNMNIEMMGQNVDNTTETTNTNDIEVKEASDKGFVVASTTRRIIMKANAMGQDISFDSDKKEDLDGQMGQAMKGAIGKTDEFQVDNQGVLTDVKMAEREGQAGGFGDMVNVGAAMAKGQQFPLIMPGNGKKFKVGDTWSDSAGTSETVKTYTNYVIKSISGNEMVVGLTGKLAKSGVVQQQGMEIQMDLNGDFTGDSSYDTASGLLTKNTTVMDMKGSLGLMGQSAPLTMKTTITTVVNKK